MERLEQEPAKDRTRWLVARVVGVGIETADMLVHEILSRTYGIAGLYRATLV
jgi:hypothetical protein